MTIIFKVYPTSTGPRGWYEHFRVTGQPHCYWESGVWHKRDSWTDLRWPWMQTHPLWEISDSSEGQLVNRRKQLGVLHQRDWSWRHSMKRKKRSWQTLKLLQFLSLASKCRKLGHRIEQEITCTSNKMAKVWWLENIWTNLFTPESCHIM